MIGGVKNGTNTAKFTRNCGHGHPVLQFHVEQIDAAAIAHAIRPVTNALNGPTG